MLEVLEYVVKSIVKNKDDVKVEEKQEGKTTVYFVTVNSADIGAVIGKGGNIANSIRTIVQAAAYNKKLGRVRINIDSL